MTKNNSEKNTGHHSFFIFVLFHLSLNISSNNCLVMVRCGRVGSNFGRPYNLLLMTYNLKE